MNTLLIDDEASARSRLLRLLGSHREVTVIGEAQDGLEAVQNIEALRPDLIFLDVEMPGLTGFQVLQAVRDSVPLPLVVFVTGFDQHALAAFDANALAYLLKPVDPEKLAFAIERALRLHTTTAEKEHERRAVMRAVRESRTRLRYVVCRKRDGLVLMSPDEILWFEVKDGIVRARTAADSLWVNYQLADLEVALPQELFFRARREVLVNITKIRQIKPYFKSGFLLIMGDAAGTEIAVSERRAPQLRQRLPGL